MYPSSPTDLAERRILLTPNPFQVSDLVERRTPPTSKLGHTPQSSQRSKYTPRSPTDLAERRILVTPNRFRVSDLVERRTPPTPKLGHTTKPGLRSKYTLTAQPIRPRRASNITHPKPLPGFRPRRASHTAHPQVRAHSPKQPTLKVYPSSPTDLAERRILLTPNPFQVSDLVECRTPPTPKLGHTTKPGLRSKYTLTALPNRPRRASNITHPKPLPGFRPRRASHTAHPKVRAYAPEQPTLKVHLNSPFDLVERRILVTPLLFQVSYLVERRTPTTPKLGHTPRSSLRSKYTSTAHSTSQSVEYYSPQTPSRFPTS